MNVTDACPQFHSGTPPNCTRFDEYYKDTFAIYAIVYAVIAGVFLVHALCGAVYAWRRRQAAAAQGKDVGGTIVRVLLLVAAAFLSQIVYGLVGLSFGTTWFRILGE